METWVPKSDSTLSFSNLESIGDSETDLVIDTNMDSYAFVSSVTNSGDVDDDAESTSGDNSCASTDEDIRQEIRREMLCKNWWYDLYNAKQRIVDGGENLDKLRDSAVRVVQEEVAPVPVPVQDDAESNRLFWDACIAHGY